MILIVKLIIEDPAKKSISKMEGRFKKLSKKNCLLKTRWKKKKNNKCTGKFCFELNKYLFQKKKNLPLYFYK